jgi:hypothetical protein
MMNIDDLKYIFRKEIDRKDEYLYFMLEDADAEYDNTVIRHPADELEDLVPLLDCFIYTETKEIPRFTKGYIQ